jgi:hypothetical protein
VGGGEREKERERGEKGRWSCATDNVSSGSGGGSGGDDEAAWR